MKMKSTTGRQSCSAPLDACDSCVCDNYSKNFVNLQAEVKDKFSPKREQSDCLAVCYNLLDMRSRFERVSECGTYLEFLLPAGDKARLHHANFCRDRLCPMCNWRRSLKIFGQVSKIMDAMGEDYDYLFLTLTVRNCSGRDLSDTVQALYDGWRYLYNKNSEFKSVICGSFRSLEVTRNKLDGTYHPHLHCILAVKHSYWKKGYISQARWSKLWKAACDLHYDPIVHIQRVKDSGKGIAGAVAEVTKYAVKGSDYLYPEDIDCSVQHIKDLLAALTGRRLCGWTGVFARIRKQLDLDDAENGDLVHVDGDDLRLDVAYMLIRYQWRSGFYMQI